MKSRGYSSAQLNCRTARHPTLEFDAVTRRVATWLGATGIINAAFDLSAKAFEHRTGSWPTRVWLAPLLLWGARADVF